MGSVSDLQLTQTCVYPPGKSPVYRDIYHVLRKMNSLASAELLHDSSALGLDQSCRTCWSTSKRSSAGIYRCADWAAACRLSPSALCKKEYVWSLLAPTNTTLLKSVNKNNWRAVKKTQKKNTAETGQQRICSCLNITQSWSEVCCSWSGQVHFGWVPAFINSQKNHKSAPQKKKRVHELLLISVRKHTS